VTKEGVCPQRPDGSRVKSAHHGVIAFTG
jgi:hypothetical protein